MFGTQTYLDKSMNGIKKISDGISTIENGVGTFVSINVDTLTADNLSDCNLVNCTADDPTDPQDIANKEYCDDNFVDRTNNLNQDINGVKTFLSIPICSTTATTDFQLINKKYAVDNFVDRTNNLNQDINGVKTFLSVPICATNASTNSQLTNKGFTDATYVDRTNGLTQNINGTKSFTSTMYVASIGAYPTNGNISIFTNMGAGQGGSLTFGAIGISLGINATTTFNNNTPICSVATPTANNHLTRKDYIDNNFVTLITEQNNISGNKTFTGTIKSNNYDTNIATNPFNIAGSVTTGEIRLGRNQTSGGKIAMGTGLSETTIYGSIKLHATTIEDGSILKSRIIESSAPLSAHHKLFNNMGINAVLTIGNLLSKNVVEGDTTINNNLNSLSQATFSNFTPICNVSTPSADNELVRKDYCDNNFLDRTNNLTQDINGLKTFTEDITAPNIYCNTALYFRDINLGLNKVLIFHQADIVYFDTLTVFDNSWKFKCFNIEQVVISKTSSTFNNKIISLAQARFDNFTPSCTVSSPTQINHLTRKDYVDDNFLDRINNLMQNINGLKTFTNNTSFTASLISNNLTSPTTTSTNNIYTSLENDGIVNFSGPLATNNIFGLTIFSESTTFESDARFNGTINIFNGVNVSNINQTTNILNIKNTFQGGSISLQTTSLISGTQDSLTINHISCDIIPSTLNLTGTSPISILSPNNLSGEINLFNDLTSGGNINFGSEDSICNFNSDSTFVGNIFCETAVYFKDIGIGSQLNQARIFKQDDYLYFDTNIDYANGYSFRHSSNDTLTITQSETTINNQLTCNGVLKIRSDKLLDELQTLSLTSHTLQFPLEQTTLFTNTANIVANLPEVTNDNQLGLRFSFINLGSITTTVTFTAQGTNKIIPVGQMGQFTSVAIINNTKTICNLVIVKLSGIYIWTEYTF